MNMNMELRDRIKLAITSAGLRVGQVAEGLGITQSSVSQWLSGNSGPTWENLAKLAEISGTNAEWLATGRGEMAYRAIEIDGAAMVLPADQQQALTLFRQLRERDRPLVIALLQSLVDR